MKLSRLQGRQSEENLLAFNCRSPASTTPLAGATHCPSDHCQGYRYLSGLGETFLSQLMLFLLLCQSGGLSWLILIGDGARWIRHLFQSLTGWACQEFILDWYHLKHKCYELTSLICRGRKAKAELLGCLLLDLWRGQGDAALARLSEYRPQARMKPSWTN